MSKSDYAIFKENLKAMLDTLGIDTVAETYFESHQPEGWLEPLFAQMDENQVRQLLQRKLAELDEKGVRNQPKT